MKVSVTTLSLQDLDVDLLIIPVARSLARARAAQIGGPIGQTLSTALIDFEGRPEETLLCYPSEGRAHRVAVIGLGDAENINRDGLRKAAAAGTRLAMNTKATTVGLCVPDSEIDSEAAGQSLVEGFMLAAYEFDRYKTQPDEQKTATERLVLHAARDEKSARRGAERGRVEAEATMTARDLVNLSPHDKTPMMLGKIVERLGRKHGYEVSIWDKADIEKEKMGGLLGVNRGSMEPPVLIEMTWKPSKAGNSQPVVLVGKGIVYDTGGLSLKPTKGSMDHMKADMAGAAAVIGAMEAIARLDVPLYVIGLIPATDNRPGQNAYVPGDVLKMHSGMTVEVLNTDAEGRLILADALSYAKLYRPEIVIDLATLTGAQVVALGSQVAAVMTQNDVDSTDRLDAFIKVAERTGDLIHPMPMHAHYADALRSDVADIKNIGNREAGSITAAKFLENFVDYPWIHIDMAGPSFLQKSLPYRPAGGTGFGVRLLTEYIRDYAYPKKR